MKSSSELGKRRSPPAIIRLLLSFALFLAFSGVPFGMARAQEGLAQQLTDLRARIGILEAVLKTQKEQEVDRMAGLVCGGINASLVIENQNRSWDSGRAYRITQPTTCADSCANSGEDTKACDGLVLISENMIHITGNKCNYTPPERYFVRQHVFCCCR